MHEGIPFSQIEETEEIPRNSKFIACMGDGSGVKAVTKETMDEEMKKNIDILDSQEEIQANTESQKVAGALAVKEMVGELNDNLSNINTSLANVSSKIILTDILKLRYAINASDEYIDTVFTQTVSKLLLLRIYIHSPRLTMYESNDGGKSYTTLWDKAL